MDNKIEDKIETEIVQGWYLVKTFPGRENLAVEFIRDNAKSEGCLEDILDFFIPSASGKEKNEYASVMMGYFVMHLNVTPKLLKVINKVENAKVHLAKAKIDKNGKKIHSKSVTIHKITFYMAKQMTQSDLDRMIESSKIYHEIKNVYNKNESVVIDDGPLKGVSGVLKKIVGNKVHVDVEIIGRHVSIELDLSKIRKEN